MGGDGNAMVSEVGVMKSALWLLVFLLGGGGGHLAAHFTQPDRVPEAVLRMEQAVREVEVSVWETTNAADDVIDFEIQESIQRRAEREQ